MMNNTNNIPNKTIAIFYGSTTCYTEIVAEKIQAQLKQLLSHENFSYEVDLFNLRETSIEEAQKFELLIFGLSTWDFGEIQEDWLNQWQIINQLDFNHKTIALFGLGDQEGYSDWFLDAMGLLQQSLSHNLIHWCGFWPTEGYHFSSKLPLTSDGEFFVGLAIDEDTQYDLTDQRISLWCEQIFEEWQTLNALKNRN